MSQAYADRLAKMLEQTGLCKVVLKEAKADQIRVLLRLMNGADQAWVKIIDRILISCEEAESTPHRWQSHICKNYFRKDTEEGKKLVFGWYISIQSSNLGDTLDDISKAIKIDPAKKKEKPANSPNPEIMEMPLGINHELNAPNRNNKGAWMIGGSSSFKVV
jgi:hypothetical protein